MHISRICPKMRRQAIVWAFVVTAVMSSAVPKPEEKRVLDFDLSDAAHFQNEEHNPQYDHEAFLGKDDAKTFDQLAPEESQRRLGYVSLNGSAENRSEVVIAVINFAWAAQVQIFNCCKFHGKPGGNQITATSFNSVYVFI